MGEEPVLSFLASFYLCGNTETIPSATLLGLLGDMLGNMLGGMLGRA